MSVFNKLSDYQINELERHLIVPQAIGDILHHGLEVEPDMQYGLHMALSEIDPDSALLAIALCAQKIAQKAQKTVPIAMALTAEAEYVLNIYGPTWLADHKKGPGALSREHYEEILRTVPEDLEGLADLMDALSADMEDQDPAITDLTNLLSIQARAHIQITEFVLEEIAREQELEAKLNPPQVGQSKHARALEQVQAVAGRPATRSVGAQEFAGDNVIPFPTSISRH
ncbi:MAG: hypothetical protein MRY79_06220 [Alphaproteobacteria bacterium]|nr:hypothetical protein [Alphaproteobacteria bacterium]